MSGFDPAQLPHRRLNPLTGQWVLVSPHRATRPWQGQVEVAASPQRPRFDPRCYLCPGNTRAGGQCNPPYAGTFVFDNDFPALLPDTPLAAERDYVEVDLSAAAHLLTARAEPGICRVLCFSPRHDLSLAQMEQPAIRRVVELWAEQYRELGRRDWINHVQIFENKGAAMGCSNPHPHGQIWAQHSVPTEIDNELSRMRRYRQATSSTLLGDYLRRELALDRRIVCGNESFVALVPYWATWPFETMILCRRQAANVALFDDAERGALADIVKQVTIRYDNLFSSPFPYSAGLHQAPTDGEPHSEWDFHIHFYPPLLRSAEIKKFMVGYEMLAEAQRDISPEASARTLREVASRHYAAGESERQ